MANITNTPYNIGACWVVNCRWVYRCRTSRGWPCHCPIHRHRSRALHIVSNICICWRIRTKSLRSTLVVWRTWYAADSWWCFPVAKWPLLGSSCFFLSTALPAPCPRDDFIAVTWKWWLEDFRMRSFCCTKELPKSMTRVRKLKFVLFAHLGL